MDFFSNILLPDEVVACIPD